MSKLELQVGFSETERDLAKYIMENGEKILSFSIKDLAENTFTSPATIVRLCQKLGLEGYRDFKINFSAELQIDEKNRDKIDMNFPFSENSTNRQIAYRLLKVHCETIEDTLKLLDFRNIDLISRKLNKAHRIFLFANGNSLITGLDFQYKMVRIGKLVELCSNIGDQSFMSYNCGSNDIAILVSYSGETSELVKIAKILQNNKVESIAITSIGDNQLSHYCSYIINMCSREKIFSKIGTFSSRTSAIYILDLLYSCVFKMNYEQNLSHKIKYAKTFDQRKPISSPINED